jgi:hypothetical protein
MAGTIESVFRYLEYKIGLTKDALIQQKDILAKSEPVAIFDVGANIGDTTAAYTKYFPKSVIYSFEPFTDSSFRSV